MRERFTLSSDCSSWLLKLISAWAGSGDSAGGFFDRFFLLVVTSAILMSELRLTPRARVSSFGSIKSFSSIYG
jgi:hypothetical protein